MSQNTYAAFERAVAQDDRDAVKAAMAKITDHEKDLLVECPAKACRAAEREECVGQGRKVLRAPGEVAAGGHPMKCESAAMSHVGHVRMNNEDAFFADDRRCVYAVADGMGGHSAGLVQLALMDGGRDNVTVICVRVR